MPNDITQDYIERLKAYHPDYLSQLSGLLRRKRPPNSLERSIRVVITVLVREEIIAAALVGTLAHLAIDHIDWDRVEKDLEEDAATQT